MIEVLLFLGGVFLLACFIDWLKQSTSEGPEAFNYVSREGYRFVFNLEPQANGTVRAYIVDAPSFNGRASDGHATHRLYESGRGHYVCIRDDLQPNNLREARDWARYWADGASRYIKTGREFS
jgi:hypothetical protein